MDSNVKGAYLRSLSFPNSVFRIACCGTLWTSMLDVYQGICDAFVQAIKEYAEKKGRSILCYTFWQHYANLTLHLRTTLKGTQIDIFISCTNTDTCQCKAFNSLVCNRNGHSNFHNFSCDIAVAFSVSEHLTYFVSGGRYDKITEGLVTMYW